MTDPTTSDANCTIVLGIIMGVVITMVADSVVAGILATLLVFAAGGAELNERTK